MSSQEEMDGSTGPVDKASKETPTIPSTGDSLEVKRGAARRNVRPRSRAWTHFDQIFDAKKVVVGAQCKHCKKQYACHTKRNGTSSLLAHMSSCMKNSENVDANQSLINVQPEKEGVVGSGSISN
ncbi:protein kinase C zeta type [Striga asiatica]|uniref:Protein kinase C zeta type n=1 Tax=Striga asiatica TaxID=4170 RepID=A0A5A7Q245_STRAF|nr:protein kinase C zeta type [Striga asiatica]